MTKEAVEISLKINSSRNRPILSADLDLFTRSLEGLISGSQDLKIPAAEGSDIIAQLNKIWQNIYPRLEGVSQGNEPLQEDLNVVANYNIQLLINTNEAVKLYAKYMKQ